MPDLNTKIALSYINDEYLLEDSLFSESPLKINASIALFNDTYWCTHRSNNLDRNNHNYLTELNNDFTPKSYKLLTAENQNSAFEDVRLFVFRNRLMAIYTYLPYEDNNWINAFSVGIGAVDILNGTIVNQQELRIYSTRPNEKNWIPLINNDVLYLVTDFDPYFRVLEAAGDIGSLIFKEKHFKRAKEYEWHYGEVRGGTPFIKGPEKNDKWHYAFIHSSIHLPNGQYYSRFYSYTIVRLCLTNFDFQLYPFPLGYSKTDEDHFYNSIWNYASRGEFFKVVFPMGIVEYNKGLLISYGKDDCVSRLAYYAWDDLVQLFASEQ